MPSSEKPYPLDRTDHEILKELRLNGRIAVAALAEKVHISRSHAHARLTRLRDEGIITGVHAKINPAKVGKTLSAYVFLRMDQMQWKEFRNRVHQVPEVEHFALVAGEFDVILLVRTTDAEDLRRIVFDQVQKLPGVQDARTSLVFEDVSSHGHL